MNPDIRYGHSYGGNGPSRRTKPSDLEGLPSREAPTAKEPGRKNAPAVCRCPWETVKFHGCQCPGYVPYRKRARGY